MPKQETKDEKAVDFYNSDARWNTITEDLAKVYYDTFYPDPSSYGIVHVNSGDTVKFADGRDDQLYHVLMVRRDGKTLLADANNIHVWATIADLEKAVETATEAPQYAIDDRPMSGGSSESVEIQYNWKKANAELPVKVGQTVHIKHANTHGRVIGTVARDRVARVAYRDAFNQLNLRWFDMNDLSLRPGTYEYRGDIASELETGVIEKVSNTTRSDVSYEAERLRLEGTSEEDILYELADAFSIKENSVREILGDD